MNHLRRLFLVVALLPLLACGGCAVVSVAGAAAGPALKVTGAVVITRVNVTANG
jgi:hypothetical protein